jgi:signal transduction histidine kinase
MSKWLFDKLGANYILAMMVMTRIVGGTCGGLVIFYVNFTMPLPPQLQMHFAIVANTVVMITLALTVLAAQWETRDLRSALKRFHAGLPVDEARGMAAGKQAVIFPSRHHFIEALLVPTTSCFPLCLFLALVERAPMNVVVQVIMAAFMGTSVVLLTTFFGSERWMAPVTRYLLDKGVTIPFDTLPVSHLRVRMNICFSVTIVVTAVMIGALANQRALDIIRQPERQAEAVANLREHIVFIMGAALVCGFVFSRLLSNSIASRAHMMIDVMKRVQTGCFTERVLPTGNDEIDVLGRQFNAMVDQLAQNDQVIRDLNANLELKVKRRTRQLSQSKHSLKRSLRKLREYDRLKTEFFSNLSHEVRTPLTMILAPVERVLEQQATLSPQVVSMLQMVQLNGQRLLVLINRLLDFSKLEAGRTTLTRSAVDINTLVTNLVEAATPLATQRGVRLEKSCDPALASINVDEEKVDTVISNLLSNALKFTPPGGTVRLETLYDNDRVWVVVSDTGIGIPPEYHERIFERFVQVDGSSSREFSGTGLGLSLAKEFVELHGGGIYVKSEIGKGARFWFDLPGGVVGTTEPPSVEKPRTRKLANRFADLITYEERGITACRAEKAPTAKADAEKILVVDDSPEVRTLMADILGEHYQVLLGRDGAEGFEAARRELPDLIISDVMMPGVDGHEFCRMVKEDPALMGIPFVMLTAKADPTMRIGGLEGGADDYLTKPFEQKELLARVRSLLRMRRLHADLDRRNRELEAAGQRLSSMQSQLVQSEKMSSLGQLVAGLAHEINNAINAVYNGIKPLTLNLQRLEAATTAGAPTTESPDAEQVGRLFRKIFSLAEVIENGANRTTRIINDLKTFSHPGKEEPEHFDLHKALDMCVNLLSNQIKDRVLIRRQYGSIAPVCGPYGQLNQVFMNILNNARQAIPEQGEIVISTGQQGEMVSVSIRDNGVGIPENMRNRIFEPFFTTKEPGVGTGLGLSLSYGIMSKIGGAIQCHSTPGQGTEFIIQFPATMDLERPRQSLEFASQ